MATAFFGGLAEGIGNYAKYRAMHSKLGQAVQGIQGAHDPGSELDRDAMEMEPHPQPNGMPPVPAQQPALTQPLPTAAPEPMGAGKIVTSPTKAILGDKGPEAVIPLNNAPGNHVGTNMLGGIAAHARYRRPPNPALR